LRAGRERLLLLWEEYRASHVGGYGYSRWCELYRSWEGRLSPTMRQVHAAGERLFVDYAGQTVEEVDGSTGELRTAQVFVAVLGASNYTYAEASWTQSLPDWIGSHVRTLEFWAACRARSCRTTCAPVCCGRTGMSRGSTRPTAIWRRITARRSCRRG
jgi:transposase